LRTFPLAEKEKELLRHERTVRISSAIDLARSVARRSVPVSSPSNGIVWVPFLPSGLPKIAKKARVRANSRIVPQPSRARNCRLSRVPTPSPCASGRQFQSDVPPKQFFFLPPLWSLCCGERIFEPKSIKKARLRFAKRTSLLGTRLGGLGKSKFAKVHVSTFAQLSVPPYPVVKFDQLQNVDTIVPEAFGVSALNGSTGPFSIFLPRLTCKVGDLRLISPLFGASPYCPIRRRMLLSQLGTGRILCQLKYG
jgi:hypothetical protein